MQGTCSKEILWVLTFMLHTFKRDKNRLHAADIITRGYKSHAKIWRGAWESSRKEHKQGSGDTK